MERITNIPSGNYQGYIWESDKTAPNVINGYYGGLSLSDEPSNPFIVEGQLFNNEEKISYSISFVDGRYIVQKFDLKILPENDTKEETYLPGFDNAPGDLHFLSIWREEADPLCEGMMVLVPCENVFVGYKVK